MPRFFTYSKYHTYAEAAPLAQLLDSAGILFYVEHERDPLDKIYTGELYFTDPMIAVKIIPDQFHKVNELVKNSAQSLLNEVNPEYYLFKFSNEELAAVLENPGDWNYFDQTLAAKLLRERNFDLSTIFPLQETNPYTPLPIKGEMLVVGYVLSVFFGFAGLVLGHGVISAQRITGDGKKVNMYDKNAHTHAGIMIFIFIAGIILRIQSFFLLYYL